MKINPQYIVLFHHFRRFLEAATGEGIEVIPLKGAHVLTSVYPADEDRGTMADVDFLVRHECFEKAGEILKGIGFYSGGRAYEGLAEHEESYYLDIDESRHIMFEVHQYLFEPIRFPIDHAGLWERSVESEFDGVRCRRLTPEDNFVHIAFHAALHRLLPLERSLRDLELLVRNGGLDFEMIAARAREWRVTRAVWLMLWLLDTQHSDLELEEPIRLLEPPLHARVVLQTLVPVGSEQTLLHALDHRVQAALLWPWVFDSPIQVARLAATHPNLRHLATQIRQRIGI